MILNTPLVKDRTEIDTVCPAENCAAVWIVPSIRALVTWNWEALSQGVHKIAEGINTPRRSSRALRSCLPRDRRPLSVPTGQSRSRAACS